MIIQTRSRIVLALVGSLALGGCVELTEIIGDNSAETAAPARTASAPARSAPATATRSDVVPLHERASQNTLFENDSPSDSGDGGFDAGGFDEPEPETPDPGGWTG
jgi:hypothetical protein